MWAESARPVGRGSTVAQRDNTSLVMLTEDGPLSLASEWSVNEEQNGQEAGSVSEAVGRAAHTLHTRDNLPSPRESGMKPQLQF